LCKNTYFFRIFLNNTLKQPFLAACLFIFHFSFLNNRVATPTFGEGCAWKGRELHKSKQKNNKINEYYEKGDSPTKDNEGIGGYDVISNASGVVS